MVNIIIPVYNARETLPQALDSLVCQTNKKFLVTIVIDGDRLDYSDIIEEYHGRGLRITTLVLPENHGAGYARQYAMDYDAHKPAKSDYFMFLDADDMFYPIAVELLSKGISREGSDVLAASFIREKPPEFIEFNSTTSPVTWMHGKIYRAQYLRDNNIRFLDDIRYNEDSYFNVVAMNCSDKIARITAPVYLWRDNPNSITQTKEGGNYFSKSNSQYIIGQVRGLKKITEITGKFPTDLFTQTIMYIYYAMMQQEYEQVEDFSYMNDLTSLKEMPEVQEFFLNGENWIKIANSVKAGAQIDNENLIFYNTTFSDWAQKYIIKDQVVKDIT